MTTINDIVLVYFEKEPAFYARIEDINPDVKPGWYRVRFQVLTIPSQDITWILREEYINGAEFTMGGRPMRLIKLEYLDSHEAVAEEKPKKSEKTAKPRKKPDNGKVVSLFDRRR